MKACSKCGASNPAGARFCNACAAALGEGGGQTPHAGRPGPRPGVGGRMADIMFVLDCTSSMQAEIYTMRDTILNFADSIESEGVRARVGLVAFRDRLIGEEHQVLTFDGQPFTSDPAAFREKVSKLRAGGGGDIPESSLDALMAALQQPFGADVSKVVVLITDAPPHIPDKNTRGIDDVIAEMKKVAISQLYLVFPTEDPGCQVFLRLLEGARGLAFNLGEGDDFKKREADFRRTLMSLGRTILQATR
ncbi:MAG: VWA domain-containing protein [Verrucomicrobia bacterium]|nr:VWA domain-containing protein [Verrucomicrobiota bacterium]